MTLLNQAMQVSRAALLARAQQQYEAQMDVLQREYQGLVSEINAVFGNELMPAPTPAVEPVNAAVLPQPQ